MSLKGVIATGFFRTGSTFFFSSLREIPDFRCYYEPYHPHLLGYIEKLGDKDGGPDQEALGHSIGDDYFGEFEGIDVVELEKAFCLEKRYTNQPVLLQQSESEHLMNYIGFLSEHAYSHQQIPLLQANRFNFVLPWLKRVFPEYLLILITREPQAVFESLRSLAIREGIRLTAEDSKSDYWNVNEAFENVLRHFGFEVQDLGCFGYYQKLYFILLFSERVMAEHVDLVVEYDRFLADPVPILNNVAKGFSADPSSAIRYVTQNAKSGDKEEKLGVLTSLEQEIAPLLNNVFRNAF